MMLIGGSYGYVAGNIMRSIFGSASFPGTYALVGGASFIGGVTRMTMSFTIILLEICNRKGNAFSSFPLREDIL